MYNSQLRVFVCVADCGSFSRAAEKLFLSPTAVMKQINALEGHLELTLLERTTRGVRLTAPGRSVYEDAQKIFAFSREALERARAAAGSGSRVFRVGTSMLNPCMAFMNLWRRISDRLPGSALRIVPFEDNREGILSEIAALGEKFDFLVAACDSDAWLSRCNFRQLGSYHLCMAVPATHRLARETELTLDQLEGETVMLGARGDARTVDRVRQDLAARPGIRLEDTSAFYDIEVFNACERAGKLLLTLECWRGIHPSLVTIPVRWSYSVPCGLLYPLHPNESIRRFLELLDEEEAGERRT
ncbi:MAG: LysR family transcriptional regulator [Desulfovibrionaceae bacterium]|nr:LysR family transcriptional regulator [Desulfovibrionaceae bacterium]